MRGLPYDVALESEESARALGRVGVVYRFLDADGAALYVGKSVGRVFRGRVRGHQARAAWVTSARTLVADFYCCERAALDAEPYAIAAFTPVHNVARPDPGVTPRRTPQASACYAVDDIGVPNDAALLVNVLRRAVSDPFSFSEWEDRNTFVIDATVVLSDEDAERLRRLLL